MEPGFCGHLFFVGGGCRPIAEVAFGDQAQLVVVVEHRALMAGNAEILQQHVAGKDVVARHVLDGLAVVQRCGMRGFGQLFAQVQIQRAQPALHIAQCDQDIVAVFAQAHRAAGLQLLQQRRRKARLGETQETIRLRVEQAADAVELEDQFVLTLHLRAAHGFGIRKAVANEFEDQRITGQRKDHHDHAGSAIGVHQLFGRMRLKMAEKRAVTLGLALLGAAQHRV